MQYKVYSPWAEVDAEPICGLMPRLDTLDGKTIGLYAHFKGQVVSLCDTLAEIFAEKYPRTKTKRIQYKVDATEMGNDPVFSQQMDEWMSDVDGVVVAYGDAGSCSLYLGYNAAYIEKHYRKPVVMLCKDDLRTTAHRGVAARGVPLLRMVYTDIPGAINMHFDSQGHPAFPEGFEQTVIRPKLEMAFDSLVRGLTDPLTEEEERGGVRPTSPANDTVEGTYREISDIFYKRGWTNGVPIVLPTEDAVAEMLRGTDLPRDHVVGVLPPMGGKATVEKIAINAVMAGCQPTYLPLIIAAVEGLTDKASDMRLEGWTCSVNGCGPIYIINGPIREDINAQSRGNALSPFWKPNATIGRAISYIIMNIAGVRANVEDMSEMGHELRHGLVIAEDEEENPWGSPLQCDFGHSAEDSTITLFWTQQRINLNAKDGVTAISSMLSVRCNGYRPGCAFVVSPGFARHLHALFDNKQDIYDYMVEFSRKENDDNLKARMNNHPPRNRVPLAITPGLSTRQYFNDDHLILLVAGSNYGDSAIAFTGGGDHGGPACIKVKLPKNWKKLVAEYKDIKPEYEDY